MNKKDAHSHYIIILAAGISSRMGGENKLNFPWQGSTILGHTLSTFVECNLRVILVSRQGQNLQPIIPGYLSRGIDIVYTTSEPDDMLGSAQEGLRLLPPDSPGTFLALGDMPHISTTIITILNVAVDQNPSRIIIPSFGGKGGHPMWIGHDYIKPILNMAPPQTMRDFKQQYLDHIAYVNVESDGILRDIDTPEDYQREVSD
jgi:molybdenum cofactor cytidylyltransferase